MNLDEFGRVCVREWDRGRGDVIGLSLCGPSLAELTADVLAGMNPNGSPVGCMLRVPAGQRAATRARGAVVSQIQNPVTRSVVRVTNGPEDTATVRERLGSIVTVPVHQAPLRSGTVPGHFDVADPVIAERDDC